MSEKCRFRSRSQFLKEGVVDFSPEAWTGVGQAFCALKLLFKKEAGYAANFCYDKDPSGCSIYKAFDSLAKIKRRKRAFIASRK
ncbi:MAG: hypothetical protein V1803_00475 [Candidatus Roizmanbacteria bacterium]